MNDHPCHKANVWTCRQPGQPSSSSEILSPRTQTHMFLPGLGVIKQLTTAIGWQDEARLHSSSRHETCSGGCAGRHTLER